MTAPDYRFDISATLKGQWFTADAMRELLDKAIRDETYGECEPESISVLVHRAGDPAPAPLSEDEVVFIDNDDGPDPDPESELGEEETVAVEFPPRREWLDVRAEIVVEGDSYDEILRIAKEEAKALARVDDEDEYGPGSNEFRLKVRMAPAPEESEAKYAARCKVEWTGWVHHKTKKEGTDVP